MNTQKTFQNLKIACNILETRDNGYYEVYVMNIDGTAKTNVTRHPDVAWTYQAWDDKLFFISDRDTCARCYFLYESDADGNYLRKISDLQLEDSWMDTRHNGKEFIVSGRIGKMIRHQLYLINSKSGSFRQITTDTTAIYSDPCFSPNGKQIVYRHKKNRRDRYEKAELWIMNTDGTGLPRQLTHYPPSDTTAKWHDYHAGPPHWNAQAGFITYQSLQGGKYSIYAITPDGKQNFKLADFPLEAGWHDWSPDGKWLAMDMFDHEQTQFDIWLWNRKTKELRQLTNSQKFEQSPVFVQKKH
ncbi:MAG: TolB family protein [Saprospiraceae bacterium]